LFIRCKICGKPILPGEEIDEEHIFPIAIGGTIILYPTHKDCNSSFGDKVDVQLTDHKLVQLARVRLKIKGRTGLPNPLRTVRIENQHGDVFRFDTKNGFIKERRVYKHGNTIKIETEDDEDRTKLIKEVRRTLQREGLPALSDEEIRVRAVRVERQHQIQFKLGFDTLQYKRAIVKIAYEMGVYWLGDRYLKEDTARAIYRFLCSSQAEVTLERSQIKGTCGPIVPNEEYLWKELEVPEFHHLAILMRTGHHLACVIKVFNVLHGTVQISNRAALYIIRNHGGRFLTINPQTGLSKDCDLNEETMRLAVKNDKSYLWNQW
jgi:HNH endonuclease